MNILMLTSSFPRYEGDFSGPWVLEYCRELVRQGHRVTVVTPQVGDPTDTRPLAGGVTVKRFSYWHPSSMQRLAHPPGIIPQLKSNRLRYLQIPAFLLAFHRTIRTLLRNGDYDIVHSQWVIPAGYLGTMSTRRSGIPHVITSQGAEFFLPTTHLFSRFTRKALTGCDLLLPVSRQMAGRALAYGIEEDRIRVVPNAVNTEVFVPGVPNDFRRRHGIEASTKVILTIRRLVPEKRVEDVIEAFRIAERGRDSVLVIGGDGPDRAKLEKVCLEHGLGERVRFIGFINNGDLPPVYAASDVYVLSSQQEGLSLSLLEAMSCGLVVVSTGSTGGDEAIEPGRDGFLYDVGDTQRLGELLRQILDADDDTRRHWKNGARRTVVDRYSVHAMVKQWSALYEELLARSGSASR